jgi:hypothetical protein
MKKSFLVSVACAALLFLPLIVFAENERRVEKEPNSAYVEHEEQAPQSGGLLDFLPFFGGSRKQRVPQEKLVPSPNAGEGKKVISEDDLTELKQVAGHWLLTSEITEPAVRKTEEESYYRDYIVFDDEYKIEVLRGDSAGNPFIAYVYVQGDYFQTAMHPSREEAEADYDFKYQRLDFRVVFERVEKWDYSLNSAEVPIVFREEWHFRKLQSKANVNASESQPSVAETGSLPAESGETVGPKEVITPQ